MTFIELKTRAREFLINNRPNEVTNNNIELLTKFASELINITDIENQFSYGIDLEVDFNKSRLNNDILNFISTLDGYLQTISYQSSAESDIGKHRIRAALFDSRLHRDEAFTILFSKIACRVIEEPIEFN